MSKNAWKIHHSGGTKTNSFINPTRQHMNRDNADSSASDVSASASGHSDNSNKSKTIATGAAKALNRIILKSRPSSAKSPAAKEISARFQIVHLPDRSPIEMPPSEFPKTNEEFDAAISRMNTQGQLSGSSGSVGQKSVTVSARKGTQQSLHGVRYVVATSHQSRSRSAWQIHYRHLG